VQEEIMKTIVALLLLATLSFGTVDTLYVNPYPTTKVVVVENHYDKMLGEMYESNSSMCKKILWGLLIFSVAFQVVIHIK
jgi:hypothetical protein